MSRKRILIIEDDVLFSNAVKALLENEYDISLRFEAPALSDIFEADPDVILLDNTLTGVTGLEFLKQLQSADLPRPMKVVLMSGDHEIFEEDREAQRMAVGFLPKPFTPDQLTDVIERALEA